MRSERMRRLPPVTAATSPLDRLFPGRFGQGHRLLVGMIHLPRLLEPPDALPLERVAEGALRDCRALRDAGFDAFLLENFGDTPFRPREVPPYTVAAMAIVGRAIRDELEGRKGGAGGEAGDVPLLGFNVLRNDPLSALGVAAACGGAFVRVNVHIGARLTDQGILEGRAHETVRTRDQLLPGCLLLADIAVKHSAPLAESPLAGEAEEAFHRGRADALILSGAATGSQPDPDSIREVRRALPDAPILVGSGLDLSNAAALLAEADGAIVGTAVKEGGVTEGAVDRERARALVAAVRSFRPGPG